MSDPNTPRPPPRPIAPNSGAAGGDSHQIPPMSRHFSNSQASLDDSSTHPMPARKHKTTACDTCKLKKLKCRGGPPCDHCVANGIDCQIDELSDMRRKGALEHRIEMLEDAERLLLYLVETLKKDDQNIRTSELINLIRNNGSLDEICRSAVPEGFSLDEIRTFLERQFSPEERQKMPEVVETQNHLARMPKEESYVRRGRRVMPIQRLADTPIHRVPAKPWTNVTDDDDLVSHLISIWCTWSFPWFHWVNRDLFIRDMKAGDLDCEFCSPFLVNAILAETSIYSDYHEVFAIPNDLMSRGAHFHEEARRLLEEEDGLHVRLATIQGLATLFSRMTAAGKDRVGWVYLDMATRAAKEYDVAHPFRPIDEEPVRTMEIATNETLWGIFNMCCTTCLTTMRHADIEPPHRPRPPISHEDSHDSWMPYPKQLDPVQGHLSCVFHRWCDLCCIMLTITRTFFGTEDKPSASEIPAISQDVERQLQGWHTNLPECLRISENETTVPHILNLHFIQAQSPGPSALTTAERINRRSEIAREIASLLALQRRQQGTERMHPSMIQCIAVSCFTLLQDLDSETNRETFVLLCTFARDFGRQVMLARAVLQMIAVTAKHMDVQLPPETDSIFQEFKATGGFGDGRNPFWYNSLYLSATNLSLQAENSPTGGDSAQETEKDQPDWDDDDKR